MSVGLESTQGVPVEVAATVADPRRTSGPAPSARLGRFTVLRELGRGAMGVVYVANDEELGRRVAIKVLASPDRATVVSSTSAHLRP